MLAGLETYHHDYIITVVQQAQELSARQRLTVLLWQLQLVENARLSSGVHGLLPLCCPTLNSMTAWQHMSCWFNEVSGAGAGTAAVRRSCVSYAADGRL